MKKINKVSYEIIIAIIGVLVIIGTVIILNLSYIHDKFHIPNNDYH